MEHLNENEINIENETELEDYKIVFNDIYKLVDGNLVFNPYNTQNIEIKIDDVKHILERYGIPPLVYNLELYKRAFVHTSYLKRPSHLEADNIIVIEKPDNCISLKSKSNERMEYLGDGILELTVKYYLYRRFVNCSPGFLTEKKIAIVKNETIGKIAYEMGLHKWFIISSCAEEKKIRTNLKKLGCLFEAFIGAVFLDFNKLSVRDENGWFANTFVSEGIGFQMAQKFIENILENHIDWTELIETDENYKNIFQIKVQKRFKVTPIYKELNRSEEGVEVGLFLCIDEEMANYNNTIKKNAEQITALNALNRNLL